VRNWSRDRQALLAPISGIHLDRGRREEANLEEEEVVSSGRSGR